MWSTVLVSFYTQFTINFFLKKINTCSSKSLHPNQFELTKVVKNLLVSSWILESAVSTVFCACLPSVYIEG